MSSLTSSNLFDVLEEVEQQLQGDEAVLDPRSEIHQAITGALRISGRWREYNPPVITGLELKWYNSAWELDIETVNGLYGPRFMFLKVKEIDLYLETVALENRILSGTEFKS